MINAKCSSECIDKDIFKIIFTSVFSVTVNSSKTDLIQQIDLCKSPLSNASYYRDKNKSHRKPMRQRLAETRYLK
jgi:hypothetical protein